MIETNEYYVVKLFSMKFNGYTYLYAENPYNVIYIADRFSSYEEGYARMQEFFHWTVPREYLDHSHSHD